MRRVLTDKLLAAEEYDDIIIENLREKLAIAEWRFERAYRGLALAHILPFLDAPAQKAAPAIINEYWDKLMAMDAAGWLAFVWWWA